MSTDHLSRDNPTMMQRLLQFTLDLFDRAEQGAAVPMVAVSHPPTARKAPQRRQRPKNKPNQPLDQDFIALGAIKNELVVGVATQSNLAALPLQSLEQVLAPATFRHPRAVRETMLGPVLVAYAFRRGKRRTIGFSVGPDGLSVAAPTWVPLYEVDKAVIEKSAWILKKLNDTRVRGQQQVAGRIAWANGCTFAFLGRRVTVVLDVQCTLAGAGSVLRTDANDQQQSLHIGLPQTATAEQIRDAAQAWLMRQASELFTERLAHFAPVVGVQYKRLSLSSAGTRWGSASADGSIRLNWRLMQFRLPIIDYVVVHELSHLRVMDHSPRFWDTVRAVVPDYAELRGELRSDAAHPW